MTRWEKHYIWTTVLTFGGGTVLLLLLLFIHINQGSVSIAPSVILEAIFQPKDDLAHHTVRFLRLPRAIIGILAGGALAVSGSLLQTITKNPLASSGTLGIHAGSYFAVVFASVFFYDCCRIKWLICRISRWGINCYFSLYTCRY